MYESPVDREQLRQGDILPDFFVTPPAAEIRKGPDEWFIIPPSKRVRATPLAIVSQCCELAWYEIENTPGRFRPRRSFVLVAPFSETIPFGNDPETQSKLMRNGEDVVPGDPVEYFYYPPCDALPNGGVINFSTIFPIRNSTDVFDARSNKSVQLSVKGRQLLRGRLAAYFGRIPDEEWEEVQSMNPSFNMAESGPDEGN